VSARRAIVRVEPSLLPRAARLVERALRDTPYLPGALEALSAEGHALASVRGALLEGVIVFGAFAGASGAGRLHFVVVDETVRRTGVARSLAEAAIAQLRDERARFVLAELPDDAHALPAANAFLTSLGFREESRVENFFRDGVALSFMRRDLAGGG
jgi:ribosomal protein S18 acetylase RimI-like enzyme